MRKVVGLLLLLVTVTTTSVSAADEPSYVHGSIEAPPPNTVLKHLAKQHVYPYMPEQVQDIALFSMEDNPELCWWNHYKNTTVMGFYIRAWMYDNHYPYVCIRMDEDGIRRVGLYLIRDVVHELTHSTTEQQTRRCTLEGLSEMLWDKCIHEEPFASSLERYSEGLYKEVRRIYGG